MVLDMLKVTSDDSTFTEEHIIFLAGRYRSFLLKQRYSSDLKKQIPESNYQTLCLDLEKVPAIEGLECEGYYLRSVQEVPDMLPCGNTRLFTAAGYYQGEISLVSKDRMRYAGQNKWTQNTIYGSLDPSGRVYLNSGNPQFLYLKQVKLYGMFENAEEASELECNNQDNDEKCDIMEREFPIEDALVAPLIELVFKELAPSVAAPEDKSNDADDSLSPTART